MRSTEYVNIITLLLNHLRTFSRQCIAFRYFTMPLLYCVENINKILVYNVIVESPLDGTNKRIVSQSKRYYCFIFQRAAGSYRGCPLHSCVAIIKRFSSFKSIYTSFNVGRMTAYFLFLEQFMSNQLAC